MRRRPLTPGEHQPAQILADLAESRTSAWWQVSWLPDHATPGPSHTADPSPAVVSRRPTAADLKSPCSGFPVLSPVTVAGAAPASHRLPSRPEPG